MRRIEFVYAAFVPDVGGAFHPFHELVARNVGRPWKQVQPVAFRRELRRLARKHGRDLALLAIHVAEFTHQDDVREWLAQLAGGDAIQRRPRPSPELN